MSAKLLFTKLDSCQTCHQNVKYIKLHDDLTFKVISIENTAVKKASKYLSICKTFNRMKFNSNDL